MSKNLLTSLLALVCLCGCTPAEPKAKPAPKAGEHAHDHAEEGPHHGQLIELGKEEFHAELVHDDATHTITVYLLDGAGKKAVTSTAKELAINLVVDGKPQQFTLPAVPEAGDKEGESSRYQLADEPLCKALDSKEVKGRLNVAIGEKDFAGELAAHDHDHDHKH